MKQDSTNLLLAVILLSFMIYLYCYLPNSEIVEGNTTETPTTTEAPSPNHYCGDCQVVQDLICSRDVEGLTDDHKRYIAGCLTKLNKVDNEKLNDSIDDWINCGSGGKSCSFVKKVMSDLNKKGVENPEEELKDWLQKKGVAIKNKPKEAAEDPEALNNILKSLLCPINDFESCPELSPTDRAKQLLTLDAPGDNDIIKINNLIIEIEEQGTEEGTELRQLLDRLIGIMDSVVTPWWPTRLLVELVNEHPKEGNHEEAAGGCVGDITLNDCKSRCLGDPSCSHIWFWTGGDPATTEDDQPLGRCCPKKSVDLTDLRPAPGGELYRIVRPEPNQTSPEP